MRKCVGTKHETSMSTVCKKFPTFLLRPRRIVVTRYYWNEKAVYTRKARYNLWHSVSGQSGTIDGAISKPREET